MYGSSRFNRSVQIHSQICVIITAWPTWYSLKIVGNSSNSNGSVAEPSALWTSTSNTYRGQFFHVIVGGAERRQPDLLRELRESRVREQRHVAQQLVTNVRFGRVQRSAVMSDVLGGMEHPER